MNENRQLGRRLAAYISKKKGRKLWQRALSFLSAITVFCISYALVLPALTMTSEDLAVCGIEEHKHDVSCYETVKICHYTCENELHTHTASCYDGEGQCVCGFADYYIHTHDESCYGETGELLCPLPEVIEGEGSYPVYHVHTASCIGADGGYNCGYEETLAAAYHRHTGECFDEEGNLVCGKTQILRHAHGECLTVETDRVLVCGKPEHEHDMGCFAERKEEENYQCGFDYEHQHDESCFTDGELICTLKEHVHTDACLPAEEPEGMLELLASGTVGGITWEIGPEASGGYGLTISGSGKIPDYFAENTPEVAELMGKVDVIYIGAGITEIGTRAFQQQKYVRKVVVEEGSALKTIGSSAFYLCSTLQSFNFEDCTQLETIGGSCFHSSRLTNVHLPSSLKSIGGEGFINCLSLKTVYFEPNPNLTTIGSTAFKYDSALKSINIEALTHEPLSMDSSTFYGCSSLEELTVGSNVAGGSSGTMSCFVYSASGFKKITFAENTHTLKDAYAMLFSTNVEEVDFRPLKNFTTGSLIYDDDTVRTVWLPKSIQQLGSSTQSSLAGCTNLKNICFDENTNDLKKVYSAIFSNPGLRELDFTNVTTPTGLTIQKSVRDLSSLQRVTIPPGDHVHP